MSTRLARPHSARYRAALRSPWWRCLRWLAPRAQLGLCGRCRRQLRRRYWELHHFHYRHLEWEWPTDVIALCVVCHAHADLERAQKGKRK